MLISKNVRVWFILMETDKAKMPAVSIRGFLDKSNRVNDLFSANASAKVITAPESSCVSDKFKLCILEFFESAVFKDKTYIYYC